MEQQKSLVVITWDGISTPLSCILKDANQDFDILIYDYSGLAKQPEIATITSHHFVSIKSECKGDILQNVHSYLSKIENLSYKYIGNLDDDIYFSINRFYWRVCEFKNKFSNTGNNCISVLYNIIVYS